MRAGALVAGSSFSRATRENRLQAAEDLGVHARHDALKVHRRVREGAQRGERALLQKGVVGVERLVLVARGLRSRTAANARGR
jgi:ribosomal protein L15E